MSTKRNKSSRAPIKGMPRVKKNREIKVQHQIIEAFQSGWGFQHRAWPDFRMFGTDSDEPIGRAIPLSRFRSNPVFERLHESPSGRRGADAAWQQHSDRFLEECQSWVSVGVDEEVPLAKSTRGTGRTGRRLNAPLALRIEWAARRLSGAAWKEIANESFKEDQVKKAASEVLKRTPGGG
jgi:hypothetical protein